MPLISGAFIFLIIFSYICTVIYKLSSVIADTIFPHIVFSKPFRLMFY